jgi:hypothetical protein
VNETVLLIVACLTPLGAAMGAYVIIRADLARVMERATNAKDSADSAHQRIDTLMQHIGA